MDGEPGLREGAGRSGAAPRQLNHGRRNMPNWALLIVSGHNEFGNTGEKTGFWWEELVIPYYEFIRAGFEVEIASPRGGRPLPDPKSEAERLYDVDVIRAIYRFQFDPEAQEKLRATTPLSEVEPEGYAIALVVGGHGALWDLADHEDIGRILGGMMERGAVVAAIGHGPAAFRGVTLENGKSMVDGRRVTGFSNAEEEQAGLTEVVPFLLEEALRRSGADFSAADPGTVYVVADGSLVTGQNPASSRETAKRAIEAARATR
jgi:putative intracellular protease/amidase